MTNKTKAELVNEIKALQACIKANEQWRRENNSEIKELRDENKNLSLLVDRKRNDYNDINDLRNAVVQRSADKTKQIKELQETVRCGDEMIGKQASKIKQLQSAIGFDARTIRELRNDCSNLTEQLRGWHELLIDKDSEIMDLQDSVRQRDALITVKDKKNGQLRVLLNGADQVISENAKEISKLDKAIAELGHVIGEKDSEIKLLREQAVVDAETVREMSNDVSNLRTDKEVQAGLVSGLFNQIKDLKVALASAEKLNDARKFHNATVAMGNPLYFQGV